MIYQQLNNTISRFSAVRQSTDNSITGASFLWNLHDNHWLLNHHHHKLFWRVHPTTDRYCTDGVHCREAAGTGPVNLKVSSSGGCLSRSPWSNIYAPFSPHPLLLLWSVHVEITGGDVCRIGSRADVAQTVCNKQNVNNEYTTRFSLEAKYQPDNGRLPATPVRHLLITVNA